MFICDSCAMIAPPSRSDRLVKSTRYVGVELHNQVAATIAASAAAPSASMPIVRADMRPKTLTGTAVLGTTALSMYRFRVAFRQPRRISAAAFSRPAERHYLETLRARNTG